VFALKPVRLVLFSRVLTPIRADQPQREERVSIAFNLMFRNYSTTRARPCRGHRAASRDAAASNRDLKLPA